MSEMSPFSEPLVRDPAIALPDLPSDFPLKVGPLHKVQFVVEFVGTKPAMAESASMLLAPEWYRALGQPVMFAMRPADLIWHPLTSEPHGSYDSVALAWDYITSNGRLTSAAGNHLLKIAERFGPYLSRRALPLPPPEDIDKYVAGLMEIQSSLDIGFCVAAMAKGTWEEIDLWKICTAMGLELSPTGSFDWRKPDHPAPLLSVTPIGGEERFTLRGVQGKESYSGVSVGFHMPLSAAPRQGLDACFRVADVIAHTLRGSATDDEGQALTANLRRTFHSHMNQALDSFTRAGLIPGNADCLKLFS